MSKNNKAIFSWSGGKDSSLCLHTVLKEKSFDIQYLLTTLNGQNQRISMHGVAEVLLDKQAESIGLPLKKIFMPEFPSMGQYDDLISEFLTKAKSENIHTSIFGDIFLEDLREYRENQLKKVDFKAEFPLWKIDTKDVAQEFIKEGFKSIIVSVDARQLGESFAGRIFDESFLNDLPDGVDPCGENGEFHSFVFDGPIFKNPIPFTIGETVYKEYKSHSKENPDEKFGFWYCDLIP
ncbi:MAG: diphthine--ammonia ligase [Bacteroidales bacterium]|nr:diphthine--ammonia ligase [Bacteroidales bacterium]